MHKDGGISVDNRTEKRKIGDLGESLACKHLKKQGSRIVERNYLRPYGEIDIVCTEGKTLVFVEVKTVTREINADNRVFAGDGYRPEDNLHPQKLKRMRNVTQAYLHEKYGDREVDWRFDAICVYLDQNSKKAHVNHIKDIVL